MTHLERLEFELTKYRELKRGDNGAKSRLDKIIRALENIIDAKKKQLGVDKR